jgi:hypothetical protein
MTQTCPRTRRSAGPFRAATFAQLARGEVRQSFAGPQTILSIPGNPQVGAAIDPIAGGGNDCATTSAADENGTAACSLRVARSQGYTMLGAPTIIASLGITGTQGAAQIAGRLWDVAQGGAQQTLVARGLMRPTASGTYICKAAQFQRLALRRRSRRQARAAGGGPTVRAPLQRRLLDHGGATPAAHAGRRRS